MQVVDGVQRLTTINNFAKNREALSDLEYLDLNDKRFRDLDPLIRRRFQQTQIFVNVIDAPDTRRRQVRCISSNQYRRKPAHRPRDPALHEPTEVPRSTQATGSQVYLQAGHRQRVRQ